MEKSNRRARIEDYENEYVGCNEHQYAAIQLQGETVKTFTYLGSTLAEEGELDAEVTTECRGVEEREGGV